MKIWQKLILAWGLTSTLLAIISILTIRIEKQISSQTNETLNGIVREAEVAGKMLVDINELQNYRKKIIIEANKNQNIDLEKIGKYRSEIKKKFKILQENLIEAKEATENQKKIIEQSEINLNIKKSKIEEEEEERKELETLIKEVKLYQKDLTVFLVQIEMKEFESDLEDKLTERMNKSIAPAILEYYEDSFEEVTNSELITQKFTNDNIDIIRNYILLTLILTSILYFYIYRSIYLPIKYLKRGAFHLYTNFEGYREIKPKNPHDELGDFTKYFNYTVKRLQENMTSKYYIDNIINSITQNLIVLDLNKKIKRVNNNLVKLLEYDESELLEKSIEFILAENNILDVESLIELDEKSQNCLTIALLTKSRKTIEVKAYFSNLYDSKEKTEGIIFLAIETENLYLDGEGLTSIKKQLKNNAQKHKNT